MDCRWAVKTSEWTPSPHQFSTFLTLLTSSDQNHVLRFVKMEDRKQALVSRLLQRVLVHSLIHIPYDHIAIARTPQGKPYLANALEEQPAANFNFNVSHHGSYVIIVSDAEFLVGVDVMRCESGEGETPLDYLNNFKFYFTRFEWEVICSPDLDDSQKIDQFYRYWCMKESFIKAVGIGLGFRLQRLEFYYPKGDLWGDISHVRIDGKERRDWSFYLTKLPEEHWVCVAKGPLSETAEAYTKPFSDILVTSGLHISGSGHNSKPFTLLTLNDLVSRLNSCSVHSLGS